MAVGTRSGSTAVTLGPIQVAAPAGLASWAEADGSTMGAAVHGMTLEVVAFGVGFGLTGPGVRRCRRENPMASSATKAISAAASDSSRSIEGRCTCAGGAVVADITVP